MGRIGQWNSASNGWALVLLLALAGLAGYSIRLQATSPNGPAAYAQEPASTPAKADSDTPGVEDAPRTLDLTGLQTHFEAIAKNVSPSVVAISASVTAVEADQVVRSNDLNGERLAAILEKTTRVVGTGFVIDADGYILTNEHVIGEAEQLFVTTDSGQVYPAIVIGSDPRGDLAVLKIPATKLPVARFAAPESARRGQWTIALGNPYGMAIEGEMCMSVGVVSAINKSLPKLSTKENRNYSNLIQTTAEINPGSSGGPLLDLDGNVIGISTAVVLPQKQTNGIAFAMPVTPRLLASVQQLKQGREIVYGYLGVNVSIPTPDERSAMQIDADLGVRVDAVESGTPAQGLIKVDDTIVQINGELVRNSDQFVRLIGETSVDQPAHFSVLRDGKMRDIQITLRRRELPSVAVNRQRQRLHWHGMLVGPIPEHWASPDGETTATGLMVLALDANGAAARQGITQGSIITSVAGKDVRCVADLQRILNDTPAEKCELKLANSKTAASLANVGD